MTSIRQVQETSREEFASHVADAYEHLYELAHLRHQPLLDTLFPSSSDPPPIRARQLQSLLLEGIAELNPGLQAPPLSRGWRWHRLMSLRYVEFLTPRAVADQLGVSLRHYYRLRKVAIEDVCSFLRDRIPVNRSPADQMIGSDRDEQSLDHLQLLRLEAARVAQAARYARVEDVLGGVISLLENVMQQRELGIRLELPEVLPTVSIGQNLLRQVFIAVLGFLIGGTRRATICVTGHLEESAIHLSVTVEPVEAAQLNDHSHAQELLLELRALSALAHAHILPTHTEQSVVGFHMRLPVAERVVLVVDDNEDVLRLFEGYLYRHRYRVISARVAQDAVELARRVQPYAITLDLMMSGQDGWDLLQLLGNQPETRHIPIIVCTVLKQKELSLSLGAAAFLQKPVTEHELLLALEHLEEP